MYRYYSLRPERKDWTKQVIAEGRVYFSNPVNFNDPFEARAQFTFDRGTTADWRKLIDERNERAAVAPKVVLTDSSVDKLASDLRSRSEQLLEGFREELLEKIAMLSLSEIPDEILMWSHYADCHRGLCFGFSAHEQNSLFSEAERVAYSDAFPVVDFFTSTPEERARAAFLTKAKGWSYEREWRVIHVGEGSGYHSIGDSALVQVIMGSEISRQDEDTVRALLGNRTAGVQLQRAVRRQLEYSLDIIDA